LPRTAEVVIVRAKYGPAAPIDDRPKPQMREGYILVKVIAAALNPADNVYMDYGITEAGNLLGYDYAGVIEEVRPGMKRDFKKGDRICGVVKPIKGASISSSTSLLTDTHVGATHRNQRMGRLPDILWSRRTSRCTSLTT
jgi:NADPH:quinone reductase-like Zn-dependent oxidoreductase